MLAHQPLVKRPEEPSVAWRRVRVVRPRSVTEEVDPREAVCLDEEGVTPFVEGRPSRYNKELLDQP